MLFRSVRTALRLKIAQEHSELLNQHLLQANRELEQTLAVHQHDQSATRITVTAALTGILALRAIEAKGHMKRVARYCRRLAEEAATSPGCGNLIDARFVEILACCAQFHDIGTVGLPEHILMKCGKFTAEERLLMETHTCMGADFLAEFAGENRARDDFFKMAIDVARHHHERFDGEGYPDRLAGEAIPLAARIMAIADIYDALRSRRPHKPALSHDVAVRIMTEQSAGQFDPALLEVFQRCAADFDKTFRDSPD